MLMNLLRFFRLSDWKHKINGLRMAAYALFGYAVSGIFNTHQVLHLIAVVGLLMSCYALNDYYDWKILRERNYLSQQLKDKQLSPLQAYWLCWLPLLSAVTLLWINAATVLLYVILAVVVTSYSAPPLRLKHRRWLGIVTPPLAVALLFLQSFLITYHLGLNIVALTVIVFLYQLYIEFMHVLDDASIKEEYVKISHSTAGKIFKKLPIIHASFGLIFGFVIHPIFFIATVFGIVRYKSIHRLSKQYIQKLRRNTLAPEWSIYEFIFYALIGVINRL